MKNLNKKTGGTPPKKVAKSCGNCCKIKSCKEVGEVCSKHAYSLMIT